MVSTRCPLQVNDERVASSCKKLILMICDFAENKKKQHIVTFVVHVILQLISYMIQTVYMFILLSRDLHRFTNIVFKAFSTYTTRNTKHTVKNTTRNPEMFC